MSPIIKVLHRQVYGRDQFEPLNELAREWAFRFRTKTLTRDALRILKIKGFKILVTQTKVDI